MAEKRKIMGEIHVISKNPLELFPNEPYKAIALKSALEVMTDCIDYIYDLAHPSNPRTFKPQVYLSASMNINAASMREDIIVYAGLIFNAIELINEKYTDKVLDEYEILKLLNREEIRAGICVYAWRFIVLHELFHIWHAHLTWINKYKINADGKIETKMVAGSVQNLKDEISEKAGCNALSILSEEEKRLSLLTYQAIELDADTCALSMIINMLMKDTHARSECGLVTDEQGYVAAEIGLIMGAMATTFSLFDGNAGAKFKLLKRDLDYMDHPIPAIRMFVAEEVADGMLWKYYPEAKKHFEIEKIWQRIVCDIEPHHDGKVDMGRVFYYTAYTEKAQKHLEKIRFHFNLMRETLEKITLCVLAEKMEDEDIRFDPQMVWFTDEGVSKRECFDRETRKNTAIRTN